MLTRRASIRQSRKRCHAACAPKSSEIRKISLHPACRRHDVDEPRHVRAHRIGTAVIEVAARGRRMAVRSGSAVRDSRARSRGTRARCRDHALRHRFPRATVADDQRVDLDDALVDRGQLAHRIVVAGGDPADARERQSVGHASAPAMSTICRLRSRTASTSNWASASMTIAAKSSSPRSSISSWASTGCVDTLRSSSASCAST